MAEFHLTANNAATTRLTMNSSGFAQIGVEGNFAGGKVRYTKLVNSVAMPYRDAINQDRFVTKDKPFDDLFMMGAGATLAVEIVGCTGTPDIYVNIDGDLT